MPIEENSESRHEQVNAICLAGMIPVLINVYDEANKEIVDRNIVGCRAVPHQGDFISYGISRLVVDEVSHSFVSSRKVLKSAEFPAEQVAKAIDYMLQGLIKINAREVPESLPQ